MWVYRTTRRQLTGETPFFMAYGIEAVAPTEIQIPTLRVSRADHLTNDQRLTEGMDFMEEWRNSALIKLEACQRRIARHYNKVKPKSLQVGNYVMRETFKKKKKGTPSWTPTGKVPTW